MKKLIWTFALAGALWGSLQAGTFTEKHYIYCGAILELGPVGYPNWNPASIIRSPEHGEAFIFAGATTPDSLVYKSDYGYLGVDTFVVACARATQISCDTGIYIMHIIGCPPISSFTETHSIACDSTLLVPGLGYPIWVRSEIIQAPANGQAQVLSDNALDLDTLQYIPPPGFTGADTVVVECAHATQLTCETGIYIINVSCINAAGEARPGLELRIFPNPARGRLVVESFAPIEQLVVFTATGAPVRRIRPGLPAKMVEVSLDGLPAGCYVLMARSGEAVESKGFIVGK